MVLNIWLWNLFEITLFRNSRFFAIRDGLLQRINRELRGLPVVIWALFLEEPTPHLWAYFKDNLFQLNFKVISMFSVKISYNKTTLNCAFWIGNFHLWWIAWYNYLHHIKRQLMIKEIRFLVRTSKDFFLKLCLAYPKSCRPCRPCRTLQTFSQSI